MSKSKIYPVPKEVAARAHLNKDQYLAMYKESIEQPEAFWKAQAEEFITWEKSFTQVCEQDFNTGKVSWFKDGKLNISVNCIDRHLATRADQVAIIWEGDDPNDDKKITYKELHESVCKFANVLKARGVKKGDRVCLYMPMIPEAAFAMLACTRIGAVHSIVFAGFSPEALRNRILDSDSKH